MAQTAPPHHQMQQQPPPAPQQQQQHHQQPPPQQQQQLPQQLPPPYVSAQYYAPVSEPPKPSNMASNGQTIPPMNSVTPAQSANQASPSTPWCGTKDGWKYTLIVEQQPVRARMCGFGDKDRRPITPPPCIRLIITDLKTGQEIPADKVDSTFFVLQVDLWDEHGTSEKNVVRAASNSPATSISTATTTSFPPPPERMYAPMMYTRDPYNQMIQQPAPYGPPMYTQPPLSSMYPAQGQPAYYPASMAPSPYGAYPPAPGQPPMAYAPQFSPAVMGPQQSGMFTRNLIGSLTVNAFQLKDTMQKEGHWFILQDLSVRTEGSFRLKVNFIDVGATSSDGKNTLNQGRAPVLASVFSQPFQVFSAKKFPGVIESTDLSKQFAAQGIKIPIRKDGGKNDHKEEDDD